MTDNDTQDTARTHQRRKDSLMGQLVIAAAVVLLVIIGIIAARTGVNRKELEEKLRAVEVALNEMVADEGYIVSFSYEDIDIGGGLFTKRITITNPVLNIDGGDGGGFYSGLTLSSDRVTLLPEDAEFASAKLVFPVPITVMQRGKTYEIKSKNAAMLLEKSGEDKGGSLRYVMEPSKSLEILNRDTGKKTLLGMAEGADISGEYDFKTKRYEQTATFPTLIVSQENAFSVEAHDLRLESESSMDGETGIRHLRFSSDNVSFQDEWEPLGNLKILLEAEETTPPAKEGEKWARNLQGKFSAEATEFKLLAELSVQYLGKDLVPFGEINLKIYNPVAMLDGVEGSGLINGTARRLLSSALGVAAGADINEETGKINILVRRTEGGAFTIGKTTFEELAAHVLNGLISTEEVESPAVLPPAEGEGKAPSVPPADDEKSNDAAKPDNELGKLKKDMNNIGDMIDAISNDEAGALNGLLKKEKNGGEEGKAE